LNQATSANATPLHRATHKRHLEIGDPIECTKSFCGNRSDGPRWLGKTAVAVLVTLGLLVAGCGAARADQAKLAPTAPQARGALPADQQREFVARVLGDTEDVWGNIFRQMGKTYQPPKLVLFSGTAASACGSITMATAPFYCASEHSIFLERNFSQELSDRYGVSGDFARAFVIAQQVGHHVQNQLGLMDKAQARMAAASGPQRNALSVDLELQADCFAGVWGNSAAKRGLIDANDVESGIAAAKAMGDDRMQKRITGNVVAETFTHGSSEQRARWFKIGLDSGDIRECNTFAPGAADSASSTGQR
jgi:predicted metalloprotease